MISWLRNLLKKIKDKIIKSYRQELRDITNGLDTVEKIDSVEFPEKP